MLRRLSFNAVLIVVFLSIACVVYASDSPSNRGHLNAADIEFLQKKIVARCNLTARGQLERIMALGVDIFEHRPDPRKGYVTALVDANELLELEATGAKVEVQTYDWYDKYAQRAAQKTMGEFYDLGDVMLIMDSIHLFFPSITDTFTIGMTLEGRPIRVMKISDNPTVDEDEPEVFFDALHHAREAITPMILLETMRRLVFGYGSDSLMTYFVNEREIFFCPVLNPDGFAYNKFIEPGGGGMWRKNRNMGHPPDIGVDPNRNYGYLWGLDDVGSSPDPGSETFRGDSAFSELEIQAMRGFINSRDFVFVINYHSSGDLYLWPFSYQTGIYSPDETLFQLIGDSMATTNGYLPQVGWTLYPTNGDADDWNYGATGEHNKILSYTPEVGSDADGGFWPVSSQIPIQIEENQAPNMIILDLADAPEEVYPANVPTWTSPEDIDTSFFNLTWSDTGGPNAGVSFRLRELFGIVRTSDDVESGSGLWTQDGFTISTTHSASGIHSYFGGSAAWLRSHLESNDYLHVEDGDTLRAKVWYDIENHWDYAYVDISTDQGLTWSGLDGNLTSTFNPNNNNRGNGITGSSGGGFVDAWFPLDDYIGQDVLFRLSYEMDGYVAGAGIYFDDISPLVDLDSVVVVDPSITTMTYPISGKPIGDYWYDLNATDIGGQTGGTTAPHHVNVDYNEFACDCPCVGDPSCDTIYDVFDVVAAVDAAFRGGTDPFDPACPYSRSDVVCDSVVDVFDVVAEVDVAFRGGVPAVVFCYPCAP